MLEEGKQPPKSISKSEFTENSKVIEFVELHRFFQHLGKTEEEATKKVLNIIDAHYGVPVSFAGVLED